MLPSQLPFSPVAEFGGRRIEPAGPLHQILDGARREQASVRIERIDLEVFWPADDASLPQTLDHLRIPAAADVGVAGNAADRLLSLVLVSAEQEIGDSFFGDDV